MYTYKVTHIPTRHFYVGVEELEMHQSNAVTDPMEVFASYPAGSNGDVKMINVIKEIISRVGDKVEAKNHLAVIAKHSEGDPNFLGIKMSKKSIKSEEVTESPTAEVDSPKKINKDK